MAIRVLLIRHHPFPANSADRYPSARFPLIPLGLAYVAAALQKADMDLQVLDSYALIRTKEEFRQRILASRADLVGVTTTTDGLKGAFEAAELVKVSLPKARIVLGGAHMATYPEETLMRGPFDFGVIGEGEQTMVELADALSSGQDPTGIPGLLVKTGDTLSPLKRRERIADLDQLPHPARELFPNHLYRTALGRNPVSYILTSRGCPFNCIFCDHGLWGRQVTFHSPEWVMEEMERCLSHGAKEIYVYDETFTLGKKRVLAICDLIRERGMNFPWVVSSRVDTVDEEMVRTLRKAGCRQMRFGVETGTPEHLKKLKKGITLEQVQRAFQTCRKVGMETFAYFMLGLPGETQEDMERTVRFALDLNPDWVNFNLLTIKPGTELFRQCINAGQTPPDFWKGFIDGTVEERDCYCISQGLTVKDLNRIIQEAYRRFYFRPSFFLKRLRDLGGPECIKSYLDGFFIKYINRFIGQFANIDPKSFPVGRKASK